MSNFGLNCDVCNRQNVGVTWVNGMKFCAKCYQETFGASKDWQLLDKDKTIAEQRKQIADLEAKLAESEEKNRDLEDDHNKLIEQYNKQYNDLCKEINVHSSARERLVKKVKELKQQLAEKDKAIENWQTMYQSVMQSSHNGIEEDKRLREQLAEKDEEIKNVTLKHLDMLRYFIRHNSKQGIILSSDLEREIKEIEQGEKIWQTKNFNQDKISFCIEKLEKVLNFVDGRTYLAQYIKEQIEELKKGVE